MLWGCARWQHDWIDGAVLNIQGAHCSKSFGVGVCGVVFTAWGALYRSGQGCQGKQRSAGSAVCARLVITA